MKWRSIAKFNEQFCELVVKDILGLEKWLRWDSDIENNKVIIIAEKDGIAVNFKLTCDNIESVDFDITDKQRYKYKQFAIANGYSEIWKDNPYDFNGGEY